MHSTLFLPTDVAQELAYAARFRPGSYQAAVLLGVPTDDGEISIRAYTDLSTLDGPFIFLRDLLSDWESLGRRVRRLAPDFDVIGWVSVWPGRGAALGTIEAMVHRTFFNLPHHVSLCIDPDTEQIAAYHTDESGAPSPIEIQSGDPTESISLTALPSPPSDVAQPSEAQAPHTQE